MSCFSGISTELILSIIVGLLEMKGICIVTVYHPGGVLVDGANTIVQQTGLHRGGALTHSRHSQSAVIVKMSTALPGSRMNRSNGPTRPAARTTQGPDHLRATQHDMYTSNAMLTRRSSGPKAKLTGKRKRHAYVTRSKSRSNVETKGCGRTRATAGKAE